MPKRKKRVLFLCTGNSCRSQMAEAFTRELWGDRVEPFSAGVEPKGIDPRAVQVMDEVGVDILGQRSKHPGEFAGQEFDLVVTVCDRAKETCPIFPGDTRVLHFRFDDPPGLAKNARSEEEALSHYLRVRDEIKRFVEGLPGLVKPR